MLILAAGAILSGCASNFVRMPDLPKSGDSLVIDGVNVKILDLSDRKNYRIKPPLPRIPAQLLDTTFSSYLVGPFDVLIVTIWEHPELTQPLGQFRNDLAAGQLVDADGCMFFPFLGRIKVAGQTTAQIQNLVSDGLAKVLKNPQVDIKVSAFRSKKVFVSGHVRTPGVFTIEDMPMQLPDLLNKVGGFLPTGDASGVLLIRNGLVYELDIDGLQQIGAPLERIRILPGDQIRVPSSDDRVAYVFGEVPRPSVVQLNNGRKSLIRGLAEAGGFRELSADAAGLYVLRPTDSSTVTIFTLDGRSPVALAQAGQFQLRPRDLVYVDQSGLSRWSRVFQLMVPISNVVTSAISTGTGSTINVQSFESTQW